MTMGEYSAVGAGTKMVQTGHEGYFGEETGIKEPLQVGIGAHAGIQIYLWI
jgi:hypothetical protein